MGPHIAEERGQGIARPSGHEEGDPENRQGVGRRRKEADEEKEGQEFRGEERVRPDGKRPEILMILRVRKQDVPFQEDGEGQDDHEYREKRDFFQPGLAHILDEHVRTEEGVRQDPADGGQRR